MTRLEEAIRRKFKTRAEALAALGFDESILDDQPIKPKEHTMAKSLLRFQDPKPRRQMARDAEPTKQFRQDDETGIRITPERIEQIMELLGGADSDTAKRVRYLLDQGMSCDADVDDRLAALRSYLEKNGTLTSVEIEEAVEISRRDLGDDSGPVDLPSGGLPQPGGRLTPLKNGAMDARSAALALASRITIDHGSVGTQLFGAPPTPTKSTKAKLASDAAQSSSSRAMADYAKRFPGAEKIGFV
jgi:hypothetical protein